MTDDAGYGLEEEQPSGWDAATFLTPAVSAIAAFVLAVSALLGQNVITVGVSAVIGPGFSGGGPNAFYVAWALGTVVQAGMVLLLARRAFGTETTWEGHLARAAVVVAVVTIAAALLILVGGLTHDTL